MHGTLSIKQHSDVYLSSTKDRTVQATKLDNIVESGF